MGIQKKAEVVGESEALFSVGAGLMKVSAPGAEITTTKGSPGTVNVFCDSGQIRIENKTNRVLDLTASYYGA